MSTLDQQEHLVFVNTQYSQNKELIESIKQELKHKTSGFSMHDLYHTQDYVNDTINIFRFLKDSNFDKQRTLQRLTDTIHWRLKNDIQALDYHQHIEFFQGLAFFRHQDQMGQPVLSVRLRYFPVQSNSADRIGPYAALIMEIARKLTLSRQLFQITVIVDISQAPLIAIDRKTLGAVEEVLSARFPGMIGSINVLNFGWLYQGLWSVLKRFLNKEQRDSIQFTNINQLQKKVDRCYILKDMGGSDSVEWTIESDSILTTYGQPIELPNTPPASVIATNAEDSEDEFFECLETFSPTIHNASKSGFRQTTIQPQDILLFWRKPAESRRCRRRDSSIILVAPPMERSHRFLPVSGIASWAILYLILRGPVEGLIYQTIIKTCLRPHMIPTTTLGLTATVAAMFSSSLSNALERLKNLS